MPIVPVPITKNYHSNFLFPKSVSQLKVPLLEKTDPKSKKKPIAKSKSTKEMVNNLTCKGN